MRLPTKDNVSVAEKIWEQIPECHLSSKILSECFKSHPKNEGENNLEFVVTKVVMLNRLYHSRVLDEWTVAKHIVGLKGIDQKIQVGHAKAVEEISKVKFKVKGKEKEFQLKSFASKYCHFHQPAMFAIYDTVVLTVLKEINGRDRSLGLKNSELSEYEKYREAIKKLCAKMALKCTEFGRIDKFLWLHGLFRKYSRKEQINKAVEKFFDENKNVPSGLLF